VRLWRVLPRDPSAEPAQPGGALWFPRPFQGVGRHDNPSRYGCLYLAEQAHAAVAETLAPFRGSGDLRPEMLERAGRPLWLAELALPEEAALIELDDPGVLVAAGLRPSRVATRQRRVTQADAERLFDAHPEAAGLRWWSTLEASWAAVTLFDRAAPSLSVSNAEPLGGQHPAVVVAAAALGLA
jgi:hypothetical protein